MKREGLPLGFEDAIIGLENNKSIPEAMENGRVVYIR